MSRGDPRGPDGWAAEIETEDMTMRTDTQWTEISRDGYRTERGPGDDYTESWVVVERGPGGYRGSLRWSAGSDQGYDEEHEGWRDVVRSGDLDSLGRAMSDVVADWEISPESRSAIQRAIRLAIDAAMEAAP